MSRKKRKSAVLSKAATRANNLKSIADPLDLGNGLTLAAYRTEIAGLQAKLDLYNNLLGDVDGANNDLLAGEKAMRVLSEQMLDGVGVKFGKDSNEYEKAGGVRKSERKKPARKLKAAKS